MAIQPVTNSAGTSAALNAGKTLAGNFDSFLKLLTTQLQQQDPLSPMDATQFTTQLVEYASVEQAIRSNSQLEKLTSLMELDGTTSALGYLGNEVVASADRLRLAAEGDATFTYGSTKDAAKVEVKISDASGKLVRTLAGGRSAEPQTLTWDGRDAAGTRLAAGEYKITVEATDAAGTKSAVGTSVRGRVDGVESRADGLYLVVGGRALPLATITAVHKPAAPAAPTA